MKRCCTCKVEKIESEFGKNAKQKDGLQKRCLPCARAASSAYYAAHSDKHKAAVRAWKERNQEQFKLTHKKWRSANPEKVATMRRAAGIRRKGIEPEEYVALLLSQDNCCAICKGHMDESARNLSIDHDHSCCSGGASCGRCVRGILCGRCNSALGLFGDSIENLQAAIDYLVSYTKQEEEIR